MNGVENTFVYFWRELLLLHYPAHQEEFKYMICHKGIHTSGYQLYAESLFFLDNCSKCQTCFYLFECFFHGNSNLKLNKIDIFLKCPWKEYVCAIAPSTINTIRLITLSSPATIYDIGQSDV